MHYLFNTVHLPTTVKTCNEALMDINRLRWASRRGMLELDLVLLPFLENVYPTLTAEDQARFVKLLECEDQDLFSWFLRKTDPTDEELHHIVTIIRDNTGLQT